MERLQNEKDMWEQKFEQKRKALKEIEQQLNKENAELEKKLCLLQESYTRLDQEKRRMESDYQDKVQEYEAQIQNLDSTAGEAYYYGNAQAESIMQLKATTQELERQLSDLQSTYDKDKALWEGKCQFLENQKENYKKDLIESQRKFEITLEQLQKRGTNAQDKYQFNQNALVKVIENKYKAQIKEMLESHQQLQNEAQNKNKRLEEENRRLHQACLISQKEMEIEKQQLEQKARELQKVEQSLQNDLNEVRADRDRKVNELQKQLQKDKEMYKMKMTEAEKKQKELEVRRTQMIFDMEKEKARWQMEFDNVLAQKRELEDIITNLERRKDLLFKENERLKSEWKAGSGQQINGNRSSLDARLNSANPSAIKLGGLGFTSQTNGLLSQSNQTKGGSRSSFQNQISLPQQQQQIIGLSGVKSAFQTNSGNSNSKLNLLGLDRQNMPPAHPLHPQKLNFQTNQQNNRYANGLNTSASKSNDTSQEQYNQNIDNGCGLPEPQALSSLTNWQNQIQPQSQVPQPTAQVGSGQKMIRQSIQGLNNPSLQGNQAYQLNKGKQSGQQLNTGGVQTMNSEKLLNSSYQSNFGGTPNQNKNQKQSSRYSKQNQLNE